LGAVVKRHGWPITVFGGGAALVRGLRRYYGRVDYTTSYLRTLQNTHHSTHHFTTIRDPSLTTFILRSSRLHMQQVSWTILLRALNSEVPRSIGKVQATFIHDRGPISHAVCGNLTSTSASLQGWEAPPQASIQLSIQPSNGAEVLVLLPSQQHGNFKGTRSVRPLGIAGSAAESQQLALGATWRGPRRDTARLAQHRFLMPKRNRGMPHRAPQFLSFVFRSPHQS
jgi:hypothetical protein